MNQPRVLVLAGGRGTRLRPLTDETPKPLVPFLTTPVLWGWLHRFARSGLRDVVLLVGPDAAPFLALAGAAARFGLDVRVRTEPVPRGSGGAIAAAAGDGVDDVVVVNADVVTGAALGPLLRRHGRCRADATLLAARSASATGFGRVELAAGRVAGFTEKPIDDTGPGWVNVGVYVLGPRVLRRLPPEGPCDLEAEVFPALPGSGYRVAAHTTDAGWADLGTPARYLAAHRAALDSRLRWPVAHGFVGRGPGVRVHHRADVAPDAVLVPPVLVGPRAGIAAGAVVGPHAVVGRGATVGERGRLSDAVVLDGAWVPEGATITGAVVGPTFTVACAGASRARLRG